MSNYGAPDLELRRFRPGMHLIVDLRNPQLIGMGGGNPDIKYGSLLIVKNSIREELTVMRSLSGSARMDATRYAASMELELVPDEPCGTCMPSVVTSRSGDESSLGTHVAGTRWRMINVATRLPFNALGGIRGAEVEVSFGYAVSNLEYEEMRKQAVAV